MTSSLKSIGSPGLRSPPRRFKPAMKRWTSGLRGHRERDWGCLPSGMRPAPELARRPRVSPRRNALTALEVIDLMAERYRARDKEKRLYARLPRLEESPKTHAEVELFLTAIEEEAERAGLPDKLYKLAINQMSITLATSYRRLSGTKFSGLPPTYERLVEAMVEAWLPESPRAIC